MSLPQLHGVLTGRKLKSSTPLLYSHLSRGSRHHLFQDPVLLRRFNYSVENVVAYLQQGPAVPAGVDE
jgi:hypothetical protein